jgi:hypothetical protein
VEIENPESSGNVQISDLNLVVISEEISQIETEKAKDTGKQEKIHILEEILELDIDKIEPFPDQPRNY